MYDISLYLWFYTREEPSTGLLGTQSIMGKLFFCKEDPINLERHFHQEIKDRQCCLKRIKVKEMYIASMDTELSSKSP